MDALFDFIALLTNVTEAGRAAETGASLESPKKHWDIQTRTYQFLSQVCLLLLLARLFNPESLETVSCAQGVLEVLCTRSSDTATVRNVRELLCPSSLIVSCNPCVAHVITCASILGDAWTY